MPTNITDVDAFTDPLTSVAAGDSADGANELSHMQKVANRTRNLKNRIDLLQQAVSARLSVPNDSESVAGTFALILVSSYYRTTSWTVGATTVQVPEAGLYRISVKMMVTMNPVGLARIGIYVDGSKVGEAVDNRNPAPQVPFGAVDVPILDPASELIDFRVVNGIGLTPVTEPSAGLYHQILITKIGEV